jgi:uncharacterized protein YlzI (FlbEa/FlbD family)
MIRLIRKDGMEILLNVDSIRKVETTPETVITFVNGEKVEVKNSGGDILQKIDAYRIGLSEKAVTPEEEAAEKKKEKKPKYQKK